MHIGELWRYPVKSMRGERLSQVTLLRSGIEGDRNIVVVSHNADRIITARTHPKLLGLRATVSPDGVTLIEGYPWHSAEALALSREAAGEPVSLVDAGHRTERFDILPLLVATDGAIGEIGINSRRLRPNIIVVGVVGQAEREWPGADLQCGEVTIRVAQLRMRCVMTTFDPDTLEQDLGVLRRIVQKASGKLALDCSVGGPGALRVGDNVTLKPEPASGKDSPVSIKIVPPFTDAELAAQKVQIAEDLWNTRNAERVALAYTEDTHWRNRTDFFNGRREVVDFLKRKWERELDYRLKKELWGFRNNRMAVKFQYEWHDSNGQWYRSYGNELWEFAPSGLMQRREASINDLAITEEERIL